VPAAVPASPLTARLDAVLANTNSCLLVTDGAGTVQYRHQSDVPFAPASTQKLFVAAAALDRLGPAYRFTTTVVARRAPVNGQVDDLWLVGSGDPVLSTAEFTTHLGLDPLTASGYPTTPIDTLAAQLAAAGVRRASNGVHGDDSRYERLRFIPSWPPAYQKEADIAPLGALEVDHGLDRWSPAVLTADPAAHGAGVLARLLGTHGVLASQGTDGVAPAGSVVLARVQSPPLADIVAAMLRSSDNLTAELLVREMDRQAGGNGTTAGGLRLVLADMARLGVPTAGTQLVDGSGLDGGNRTTCTALLTALGLGDQARFSALRTGLAVAGQNGTLVNRFLATPIAGHLVAKTGSIDGVNALVGRLDGTLSGRPLRFALVANGSFGYRVGVGLEDRVVAALAEP
jgi:serine-type D-Ala-D-Ala carboxypeptidase/endopeptidase (penicillin-binding protein 4)